MDEKVTELCLCLSNKVQAGPGILYRFIVNKDCEESVQMALFYLINHPNHLDKPTQIG